ncbi:MAG: glutathione S-transferase family protein [Actinomycetota bacterium]
MAGSKPVLWQIRISHYSEKARWALDYKGVEHQLRAPPPGVHILVALALTRGRHKTFPVLQLEGKNLGDSTAIIAALEDRFPEPPLYPEDPEELRRALELEDWFDEELGPHIRLLVWHEAARHPEQMAAAVAPDVPRPLRRLRGAGVAAARYASAFAGLRYGVKSPEAAELARGRVLAALDRLEAELDGNEYLVGERFSVADLTAAALLYPLAFPPEGPPVNPPAGYERFRGPLADRPGYRWVEEMFRRHRRPEPALVAAGLGASR